MSAIMKPKMLSVTALVTVLSVFVAGAQVSADMGGLQVAIDALTPAQQAFIDDPSNLQPFGLTKDKMIAVFENRDPETFKTAIIAMMETTQKSAYQPSYDPVGDGNGPLDPAGDFAEIPYNTDAADFNGATTLRPAILDKYQRDAGPFSLKRYMHETDGIPTFAGAPVALRQEDLVAGNVEVAFLGVPLGLSSGWRDSHHAPKTLRAMYGIGGYDIYGGVDPALELILADYGDLRVDNLALERNISHIREMVAGMAEASVIPFVVGGDHSVMYPTVAAMVDTYGQGNVGVVHLDAHYNGARDLAHYYSDEQSVARLVEDGLVAGENLVQVGLRGPELSQEALDWMRSKGLRYHTMAEVESKGWERVMKSAIAQAKNGPDNIFISFDISVLDPAFARAAGRPVPGGLTMREAVPLVRRLCAETNVVGFEMLDVAPMLDLSYQTTLNANYIMHSCLTGIAMRKVGIKKTDYLSPMTVRAD